MRLVHVCATLLCGIITVVAGSANADVLIKVNKGSQHMSVLVDGQLRYSWPVSTGKAGYETPVGSFTPFHLVKDHASKEWDNSPMPHSIFFTHRGHAIHGSSTTRRLGSPASRGCVRLVPANAAKLFALVKRSGLQNTRIVIQGNEPKGFSTSTVKQPQPKRRYVRDPSLRADYAQREQDRWNERRSAEPYGYGSPLDTKVIFDWR
jgi:hypothetical protein